MRNNLVRLLCLMLAWFAVPSAQAQPDVNALVQGNNEFAFALYERLAEKDGNLFFSPYSISNALAMTYAGARGDTAKEMSQTLHFTSTTIACTRAFNSVICRPRRRRLKNGPSSSASPIACGARRNTGFMPEFLKIGQDFYRRRPRRARFPHAPRRGPQDHQRLGREADARTRSRT